VVVVRQPVTCFPSHSFKDEELKFGIQTPHLNAKSAQRGFLKFFEKGWSYRTPGEQTHCLKAIFACLIYKLTPFQLNLIYGLFYKNINWFKPLESRFGGPQGYLFTHNISTQKLYSIGKIYGIKLFWHYILAQKHDMVAPIILKFMKHKTFSRIPYVPAKSGKFKKIFCFSGKWRKNS